MALPASDTFTAANGALLSGNWSTIGGAFVHDANRIGGNDAGNSFALWSADAFNPNHAVQAKIYKGALWQIAVWLRADGSKNGYLLYVNSDTELAIYRVDAGSATQLQAASGLTVADGQTLRQEGSGSTLRMYQDAVQRGTDQTDSTYTTGAAGIFAIGAGQGKLDDFLADNLTPAVETLGYLRPNRLRPRIFAPGLAR